MNPSAYELARSAARHERQRAFDRARRQRLHEAAMVRRMKRKKGGKK